MNEEDKRPDMELEEKKCPDMELKEDKHPNMELDSGTHPELEKEVLTDTVCSTDEVPTDGNIPHEEAAEEVRPEILPPENATSQTQETFDSQSGQMKSLVSCLTDELREQFTAVIAPVLENISTLQQSFDSKLKNDKHKDEIIDRQYRELEEFRSGLIEKVTLQIANDIIFEIDDTEKILKFYRNTDFSEENYKKLLKIFQDFSGALRDLLDKHEISSYCGEIGSAFNPKRQRAMKTTETSDASLDKTIKESLRWGFELEGKIIRAEMVDVYVYKKTDTSDKQTETKSEKQ